MSGLRSKIIAPIAILAAGVGAAAWLYIARPRPEQKPPEIPVPVVSVITARRTDVPLSVASQGTVRPRTQSHLVPEVPGRVLEVADAFVAGGFFSRDEVLVTLDPHDYRLAVIRSEAEVARARLNLAREEAEAEVAREEWGKLGSGTPGVLTLREPQLLDARAALAAAEANLGTARLNLDRTRLRAPYDGRVREKVVDVGQYVGTGAVLATLYSVDEAEVRLPIADADLAYLDIPLDYRGEGRAVPGPRVVLSADFAGRRHAWEGRIDRTEGEIDATSRLVHVVARVKAPYARTARGDRPPLAVGMYVEAEIEGRVARDVIVIPRIALRDADRVLVVDDDDRLRWRAVTALRLTPTEAILIDGIEEGERVCLSPIEGITDGTRVRTLDAGGAARNAESEPTGGATPP